MTYQVPYYAMVGVYLLFKGTAGEIFGLAFALEETGEGGIEADIAGMVKAAEHRGLTPLSVEEYDAWARGLAAAKQRERLLEVMQARTEARAIDPARLDEILASHKGQPGGDV